MFEVAILGILQGIAEFLPISSSGHLVIAQNFLGVNKAGIRLDVFLHFGTLLAIFAFYWKVILRLLGAIILPKANKIERLAAWMYLAKIIISALPAIIVYFSFREQIEDLFENSKMVGALLMFTGAVVLGTRYLPRGTKDVSLLRALIMGVAQAVALLPGISRSGMTLASARGGRVDGDKAAEFSFLMSAPLIMGAAILELVKSLKNPIADETSWPLVIFGSAISAVVGYYSLVILVKMLRSKNFWLFGIYCISVGLITLVLSR